MDNVVTWEQLRFLAWLILTSVEIFLAIYYNKKK